MTTKYLPRAITVVLLYSVFELIGFQELHAQVYGPQEVKWLWVGSLRHWFSSACAEIEYGRRGRGLHLNTDQDDGLRWPAQYQNQDHSVGKALWIGTTNFTDPTNGLTYPYKVISLGRSNMYINSVVYPEEFRLVGRFNHPTVLVDNVIANDLDANDLNLGGGEDEINPSLPADRMIYNRANTPLGITIYRKVLAFTQQYNDNYFIYEYVFKNTGLIDNTGGQMSPARTLTGVVFDFRYRLADDNDGYIEGWGFPSENYGKNTINDAIGQDAAHSLAAPNNFRANLAYYGPSSASTGVSDDIGGPDFVDGHVMGGTHFMGELVLHADKSARDTSDDLTQPTTTQFMGSDGTIESIDATYPFNAGLMTQQYQSMTAGHPVHTHAEQVGEDVNGWPTAFANTWGGNTGGYQNQQGFGPYTIAPGDSVRIVIAEAVAGINHTFNQGVARTWYAWHSNGNSGTTALQLPAGAPWNGGTTTDANRYKNAWVFSGKDSLFQTFRRARANFAGGYNIPNPPPPPDRFSVTSGGDRITLQWSGSAESSPNFNGYQIYRSVTKTDTTFQLIFSCDKNNVVHSYDDKTPQRGFNYYYYIQTKDNGSTNNIEPGVPLVSSMFYTMTNTGATLLRPAGNSLSQIRVVPNPYNIRARGIQFGSDISVANQLAFFGLPPMCTIRIFTETGDLIQTINHTDGSGDQRWNSLTSSGQIIVSGLYIAYFEVTQDYTDPNTGQVVFKSGQSIYRKFIVIR